MSRKKALAGLTLAFGWAVLLWGTQNWLTSEYSRTQHVILALTDLAGGVGCWIVVRRLMGLSTRPTARDRRCVPLGALSYLAPTAVAITVVLATGLASINHQAGWGSTALEGLSLLGLVLALEAIPEELIFRGLIQSTLTPLAGRWLAVVGQAALFTLWGAITGSSRSLDRLVLSFCFSLVLGIIRLTTGTAATTIGFHAAFQTCAQWLSQGNHWDSFVTSDPQQWLAGAIFIPAAAAAPITVWVVTRRQVTTQTAAVPHHSPA